MLKITGWPILVSASGASLIFEATNYERQDYGGGMQTSEITTLLVCTAAEASQIINLLDEKKRQADGEAVIPVPVSARQILAVYEFFAAQGTPEGGMSTYPPALALTELWMKGERHDDGRTRSEPIRSPDPAEATGQTDPH